MGSGCSMALQSPAIVDRRRQSGETSVPLIASSSKSSKKKKQTGTDKAKKKVIKKPFSESSEFLVGWQVYHLQHGYLVIIRCLGTTDKGIKFLVTSNGKTFVLPVTVRNNITLIKKIY